MKARKNLACLRALVATRLSRYASEAGSFWAALIVDTLVFFVQALAFWLIYLNVDDIGGWDKWRSVFFVGTFTLVDGLYMTTYFFGVLGIPEAISTGRLDLYLAKPLDPLLHLSFERFNPGSLFIALPALLLIVAAAANMGVSATAWSVAGYLGAVVLMLVLVYDLMVLMRVPAFWLKRLGAVNAAENALVEFAFRVPPSAYRGGMKLLFRVVLPYGLIAAFPTEVFFGDAGAGGWAAAIAVVAAFTVLMRAAWKRGLARYESAGG